MLLPVALLATQFDFGGSVKPKPPKLRLELVQVGRADGGHVRVGLRLINRGGGEVSVDAGLLEGDLTQIGFYDRRTKRRIFPTVGNEQLYIPLHPERAISLGQDRFTGFEKVFVLPRDAAGLLASAGADYPEGKGKGLVWEGRLQSEIITLVGVPSRPVKRKIPR